MKLQGKKLADVVAEVLTEAEEAEHAAQKAEVMRLVQDIQQQIAACKRTQQRHLEAAAKATERMKVLAEQLERLKAGDRGALKHPENTEGPWPVPHAFIQAHENLHRDMETEQLLRRWRTRKETKGFF